MLDHKFSWQPAEPALDPVALAEELKGFNPNQPRSADGRFGSGAGRSLVGQIYLDAQKVAGHHTITVHNSRVRKYKGHDTVESFIAGHKRGRAAAMRELTADHATGKISFGHPETGEPPAVARPKAKPPAVSSKQEAKPTAEKPDMADRSAAKAEAGRSIRQSFLAKPGASLKPIARDPKRSDLDTLREAHAQVANSGDVARLSHVRAVLGNYSRSEQDRMFTGAVQSSAGSGVHMGQIDDNKAIDQVEKAAAFSPAGDPFHLLRVNHRNRKSADDFDADDLDAIDAVTPAAVMDLFDDTLLASAGYA